MVEFIVGVGVMVIGMVMFLICILIGLCICTHLTRSINRTLLGIQADKEDDLYYKASNQNNFLNDFAKRNGINRPNKN